MESKTVKVIDEHGIDRNANVVCGFKVDGLDYVLYWIERDGDNDNLFASKIAKNNDGTYNMINIEDSLEKNKVTELVKKLVTFAINDNASALTEGQVTLSDGVKVDVFPTLFNKEQNINVTKTYVTTVKKSVTKVSEDFYRVKKEETTVPTEEVAQPFFEAVTTDTSVPGIDAVVPSVPEPEEPVPAAPVVEFPEISVVEPELQTPEVKTEELTVPEELAIPTDQPVVTPEVVVPEPVVESPQARPEVVVPEVPPVAPAPVPTEPVVAPVPEVAPSPVFEAPAPEIQQPDPIPAPIVTPPVAPAPVEPVAAPVPEVTNELVLDGTKETNLSDALGEATVPVSDVDALREFGQSDTAAPVEPATTEQTQPAGNSGFANNKYVLIVAFVFFIASCAFLGYEVYQYLQVK